VAVVQSDAVVIKRRSGCPRRNLNSCVISGSINSGVCGVFEGESMSKLTKLVDIERIHAEGL